MNRIPLSEAIEVFTKRLYWDKELVGKQAAYIELHIDENVRDIFSAYINCIIWARPVHQKNPERILLIQDIKLPSHQVEKLKAETPFVVFQKSGTYNFGQLLDYFLTEYSSKNKVLNEWDVRINEVKFIPFENEDYIVFLKGSRCIPATLFS